jgi:hypothetical protein
MYSRELKETVAYQSFTIWIYYDGSYKFELTADNDLYSRYDRWYGKKSYGSREDAIKAGKAKVKGLIKKAAVTVEQ